MKLSASLTVAGVLMVTLSSFGVSGFTQTQQPPAHPAGQEPPPTDPTEASLAEALPGIDAKTRRGLALQVALDRAGFSPGEIDGAPGLNTDRAVAAYKMAKGTTDMVDGYTNPVAQYAITAEDVAGPFIDTIPTDMVDKAKLPSLAYSSIHEMLGERFHASPKLLQKLNPNAKFVQGDVLVVPNVEPFLAPGLNPAAAQAGAAFTPGAGTPQTPVAGNSPASAPGTTQPPPGNASPAESKGAPVGRTGSASLTITVTERTKTLEAKDASGTIVFHAPVTVGSENDPLPVGEWKINGVSRNPVFNYNPKLFWDANPKDVKAKIPPGPNNPVGVVWIDLSKDHYGIHGTPEPSRVGYTESHGCIRLTNWDAMRLAAMVAPGAKVILR